MAVLRLRGYERDLYEEPFQMEELVNRSAKWSDKLGIFYSNGYKPHTYQILAHTSDKRFVVMGAGRRGGKSVSAAWEAALMAIPETQRSILERKGVKVIEGRVIIGAIVMPDNQNYKATPRLFEEALQAMGLVAGEDYQWNRNDNIVYFPNRENAKSIVHFKSAEDPRKLRGEGYSWTWWDEPGFIRGEEAWQSFRPALGDLRGCGVFSTTPGDSEANWWFYDLFVDPEKLRDNMEYVEWVSLDNPFFDKEEWLEVKAGTHPLYFAREYMARWERGGGKALKLEWLTQWMFDFGPKDIENGIDGLHMQGNQLLRNNYWIVMGMDLASSEKTTADYTVASIIAIEKQTGIGYIVDMFRERIDFPQQVDLVNYMYAKWNPDMIAIESVGYQRALSQQLTRDIPMAPIIPVQAPGRKVDRILTMSPSFRNGKMRIPRPESIKDEQFSKAMLAFWNEWGEFDVDDKHKHDDTLDSVEIAMRIAPMFPGVEFNAVDVHNRRHIPVSKVELMDREFEKLNNNTEGWDEYMGDDW